MISPDVKVSVETPVIERKNLILSPRDLTSVVTRVCEPEKGFMIMTDGDGPPGFEDLPYLRLPDLWSIVVIPDRVVFTIRQEVNLPAGSPYPFSQFTFRSSRTSSQTYYWQSRVVFENEEVTAWASSGPTNDLRSLSDWDLTNANGTVRRWRDSTWVSPRRIIAIEWRMATPGNSTHYSFGNWDIALPLLEVGPTYPNGWGLPWAPAHTYFDGSTTPPAGLFSAWLGPVNESPSIQYHLETAPLEADGVSLTRSLPWSPGGSASIASASGTVEAALDAEANPWLDWQTKRPGDVVQIEIDGVQKLDGVIESVSGDLGTQTLNLSVFDKIDALTRPVVVPAWLARMSTRTGMKWCGLSDIAVIDHALAKAGFESTPRPALAPVLMPLQGSAWMPDRPDDLVKASESADSSKTAIFDVTEWGRGLSDGDIRVKPTGAGIDFTGNLRLGVFTTTNTLYTVSETSHVRVHFDEVGLSEWIGLSFDPTKIRANYFSSGAGANLCEIPRTGDEQHVTLLIDTVTGAVTLTDGTSTATGTFTPPAWGGVEIVQAFTDWLKPMLGGIYLDQGSAALDWERTAFLQGDFDAGSANEEITAFPSFTGKAIDLLKGHSEALGSVFWLDEDGHLQWRRAKRLLNRTAVRTLTATDDLLALGWKMDTSETFSGVKFSFRPVAVDRGNYAQNFGQESVMLWQGSGLRVQGDEVKEEFFGPADGEEWFYPNLSLAPVNQAGADRDRFNFGQGSWGDALVVEEGDPAASVPSSGLVITSVANVGGDGRRFKLTARADTPLPSDQSLDFKVGTSAVRGGPVTGPEIAQQWEGANLPIVRGLAKAIWSDDFVTAGNVTGDWQGLPVLEREAGEWIQNSISAQQQADWLNSLVTMRAPRLENVPIIPDFELRLGDVVWLTDDVFSQVRLKVLVTKIDYRFSPGEADMSIGCFVIESEGI